MDILIKEISQTYIFPSVIFIIMFGLGATLNLGMLKETFARPWPLIVGLFGQLMVLPLIAFLIAIAGPWPSYIAMSLIVISVCPGGSTSNAIVFALRGDVALSVSLTMIASVLTLFTIPLYLNLGFQFMETEVLGATIPTAKVLNSLAIMTILPITLGITLQKIAPLLAKTIVAPLRKLSLILIIMIIILSMYNVRNFLDQDFTLILFVSGFLAVTVILSGFLLAKFAGLKMPQQSAIVIEVGIQNTPLAIFLGASLLGQPQFALVAVAYGIINYLLIAGFVYVQKRRGFIFDLP